MAAFSCTLSIRFGDIDLANFVYYPNFYHLFHSSMEEMFLERRGCHYSKMVLEESVGFPSVAQNTEFLAPVTYGENVEITITCEKIGTRSVTLKYVMKGVENDELKSTSTMIHVCMDMKKKTSLPLDESYQSLFEGLKG